MIWWNGYVEGDVALEAFGTVIVMFLELNFVNMTPSKKWLEIAAFLELCFLRMGP